MVTAQDATLPSSPAWPSGLELRALIRQYEQPSPARATWQIANTLGLYCLLWYLMYQALSVSWWLALPLAALAGALLLRVFIIFHDCGHGSFLKSHTANAVIGFFAGVLTFTPYYHWRWEHALHHGTTGNLDRRGTGDVWTMTVQEYLEASRWRRFAYRLARNPLVLFVLAPVFVFMILQRFPSAAASRRESESVWWMNLALLGMVVGMSWIFGVLQYLVLQAVVMVVAGAAGVWLFYIQHQFEDAYWERTEDWDYTAAALQGSSYYKLPAVLRWLSGNIGYHHIHHLSSRIPNYNLKRCHDGNAVFQQVKPITLTAGFRSMKFRLWDERLRKLVGFVHLRELRRKTRGQGGSP
ncbi:MAG: fatty acid desaturase [Steroidobacteraceae bacterium]